MRDLSAAMWRQAVRDLDHARTDQAGAYFEWAAYSAQQAAEKAFKAVLLAAGRPAPTIHGLNKLFGALAGSDLATAADKTSFQRELSSGSCHCSTKPSGWRATPWSGWMWRRRT